jgi:hypothetical protein
MPTGGHDSDADPTAIGHIAVTTDDVVTALETNWRSDRHTVLRITPPFSGRMRARLHRPASGADPAPAVHVEPSTLVDDPPPYPSADDTADRLRQADAYTTARHHDRHTEAVSAWRDAVRDALVDSVALSTGAGPHSVSVTYLG